MKIALTRSQVEAIEAHAKETFPEECCGFLIGPDAEPRVIAEARRAGNAAEVDRARRYVIDPRETLRVEKSLDGTGLEILGFYHSHPNHPAVPSEFDCGHAWPWYSYVILSIMDRESADLRGWSLDGTTATFVPVELVIAK